MFASRILLQGVAKRSTGLVGLPVVPNGREVLIDLYKQTLEKVKVIPSGVPYRDSVEQITNYRMKVCNDFKDPAQIESEIDCGQIEELIEQAKDEMELIDMVKDSPIGKLG